MKSSDIGVLIEYDENGRISHITDRINYDRRYEYDENGRLICEYHNPATNDADCIQYTYDNKGRVIYTNHIMSTDSAEGEPIEPVYNRNWYEYNDNDILLMHRTVDKLDDFEYVRKYDDDGLLIYEKYIEYGDITHEKYFDYDDQNRICKIRAVFDNSKTYESTYVYDKNGKRVCTSQEVL